MNRLVLACAGALLASMVTASALGVGQQQSTFRARTDVVSVPVSVMRGREPAIGLSAADFELTDNGVRQTVDAASLDQIPIDVTLVLTGYLLEGTGENLRGLVSAEATRKLLLPADRLSVVWVSEEVRGGPVSPDYSVMTDPATKEYVAGTSIPNGIRISRFDRPARWPANIALADGLFYALARPVDPDRRHLVVAFTDGWDTASTIELDTLPTLAAHSDAVLHAVLWATPSDGAAAPSAGGGRMVFPGWAQPGDWEASFRVFDTVVRRTGGLLHMAKQAPEALAAILADFRSSYVLRYTPRGVPLAGWHELQVKVTRPGSFKIRARKGYEG